ncbi:MAG: sulfurtransferase complex subunit TusB [Rhodospirillales bacterium]
MLHTVNKSPFERANLDSCLRLARKGSAILLYEDGVYAAARHTTAAAKIEEAVKNVSVYVLGPDLAARAIDEDNVIDGVKVVDYGGFVDLVVEYGPVQAWL